MAIEEGECLNCDDPIFRERPNDAFKHAVGLQLRTCDPTGVKRVPRAEPKPHGDLMARLEGSLDAAKERKEGRK